MPLRPPLLPAHVSARLHALADAWLPRACGLCRGRLAGQEAGLCAHCLDHLPGRDSTRCRVCGLRARRRVPQCDECSAEPPAFDRTVALADYAPPLDRLVLALKFGGQHGLAHGIGGLLAARLAALHPGPVDRIVPVPLSDARLATRGYNQAGALAAAVARRHRAPLDTTLLRRVRATAAQSGLPLLRRHANLSGAMRATRPCAGAHIVLVDDVMTTGATLSACAAVLKDAGAAAVINLVVARTD